MKDIHKWSKSKTALIIVDCILCLAIIVSSILIVVDRSRMKNGVQYKDSHPEKTVAADATEAKPTGTTTARLMCAGDNLIHRSIYNQAHNRADGDGYDFSYAYEQVKEIISLSDIAFINQETLIDPEREPSTFPCFNSPTELLGEMKSLGFNVFNQATNHVLDQGEKGARRNLEYIKSKNVLLTGLYESREAMLKPQTKSVNGITFSFVGFTQYLNGFRLASDSDLGLLSLDDKRFTKEEHYELMKKMIDNAKANSDVVCVSMHWQEEDITEPNSSQQEVMDKLMEFGADIVIGTGPHVLQPIEYRQNGDGDNALIIWSLGNFISCQDKTNNLLGGIADVVVKKDYDNNKITVESAKLIPTITHYTSGFSNVRIIPFKNYDESLADNHGVNSSKFSYDYIDNFYKEMFGDKLETNWK